MATKIKISNLVQPLDGDLNVPSLTIANTGVTVANGRLQVANTTLATTEDLTSFVTAGDNITLTEVNGQLVITGAPSGLAEESVTKPDATSGNVLIDSLDAELYRSAEYFITYESADKVGTIKVMVMHNGTESFHVSYGGLGDDIAVSSTYESNTIKVYITSLSTEEAKISFTRNDIANAGLNSALPQDLAAGSGTIDINSGSGTIDLNA